MAKRGRPDPGGEGPHVPGRRTRPIQPPPELEEVEREIWASIVVKLPSDWFAPESVPLLKELCRHIRHANDLTLELAEVRGRRAALAATSPSDAEGLKELRRLKVEYRDLLRAHGYQSERIGNLATKLRLTNQSKIVVDAAARKARDMPIEGIAPWDDWGQASETKN